MMTAVMRLGLVLLALAERFPGAATAAGHPTAAATDLKPLDYAIVVTGGELLEGVHPDAHTHFLTRTLRPLGWRCVSSLTVDDVAADIKQALRFATNRAPLVIVTGGLGPTPNDITRETLAEFTGIRLDEQPEVLADLERRSGQPRDQMRPSLRRQTLVPSRGGYLKNPNGTAVGLVFETGGPLIVALPGPPRELQPMVRNELVPLLQSRFGVRPLGASLTLRFAGIGQSLISQTLQNQITLPPEVTISSVFEASRVDFTFSLPRDTPHSRAELQRLAEEVRQRLGDFLYATNGSSLEAILLQQIQQRGGSLVLADAGSGGHVAAALQATPGAAEVVVGSFAAPNEPALARLLNLPPEEPAKWKPGADSARGLAAAAARRAAAQWAVAIGACREDDAAGKAVWLAWRNPAGTVEADRLAVRDSGESWRATLTTDLLDRLRRRLR